MKDGWMNANDWYQWSSLKELNESYQNFLAIEYTNETHSSLGISHKERYLKDIKQIKFLNRTTRNVSATATVQLARYVNTLATKGISYKLSLIKEIKNQVTGELNVRKVRYKAG